MQIHFKKIETSMEAADRHLEKMTRLACKYKEEMASEEAMYSEPALDDNEEPSPIADLDADALLQPE